MKHFYHFRFLRYQAITNLLILFFMPLLLCSQTPAIQWNKTIGGNSSDLLVSLQQTIDGGYILGGNSFSDVSGDKTENNKGGVDYWVIKLDANGTKVWDKTIGGNSDDLLVSLQQTTDGGYIMGGYSSSIISGDKTESNKGDFYDYWVVKLDVNGTKVWDKTIGGDGNDQLISLQQTTDGGYILGGFSSSNIFGDKTENSKGAWDYWVVRLDANGTKIWDKTIGGNSGDDLSSLQQTTDGGYILGGSSGSNISGDKTENNKGLIDYWVVKLDANGTKVWDKTIGGEGNDQLISLQKTTDGGYIMGGYSSSIISSDKTENNKGGIDYWVVKLDANGTKDWDKTIGTNDDDLLRSLQQTTDGGYILGGFSSSNISSDKSENSKGGFDYWVVKLDANRTKVWDKTIGGSEADALNALQQTSDEGYILGGFSGSNISGDKSENEKGGGDYWVVKLASVTLTCPNSISVNTDAGKCYAVVNDIDPTVFYSNTTNVADPNEVVIINPDIVPGAPYRNVNYKIEKDGVITEQGTGGVSGKQFTSGINIVTYVLVDDPSQTCSFTVEVKDEEPPDPACASEANLCYNPAGTYTIPTISVSDNCGIASVQYKIKNERCDPRFIALCVRIWEYYREGTGTDASGVFNPGESIIEWTITDVNGNTSTCETHVQIVRDLFVTIADAPLTTSGSAFNTIYLGYGPNSLTFEATASGGSPGYSYGWVSPHDNVAVQAIYPNKITVTPSEAGTYTLMVTTEDARGCRATYTKTYYVVDVRCTPIKKFNNNIPIIPYVYMCHSGKTVCVGINGVLDHLSHGDYLGQCANNAAAKEEIITQAAKNPISNETEIITQGIKLFPNPASNYLNIEWSAKTSASTSINIIDIQGRVIKKVQAGLVQKDAINRKRISIEGLAKGIYMLELRTGADIQVSKFVIQ